ncbi:MAG: TonB-dependent receptor [Rikenellaceae bacterium]
MKKIFLFLVAMFFSVASFAQITTSGITGQVTDQSGEPLVGATVIALHTPSGTEYGAATNIDGRYTMQGMRSGGPYKVTISYIGYQTIEVSDLLLSLGENYSLIVEMVEGEMIDDIVVISTSADRFNNSKTGAATNFSSSDIEASPSVSRSIYDIIEQSPLANSTGSGISFAGTNNRYNSFQIDGAISNDVFGLTSSGTNGGSTGSNAVSLDAIEEIQIVIAPYDVRQGGFTGGGINAVTKSGTNTIKGSAYVYYNDENFYGTTAGTLAEGETREKVDEQTTKITGFTIGGPIIKDKLFAFVSLEQTTDVSPVTYYPGYSDVKDYLSGDLAQAILDHYELMTGIDPGTYGQRTTTSSESFDVMARIDWNISQKHKFMFRYQYKDAFSDSYSTGRTSYTFDNSGYSYNNITNSFVAELNSRFSNTVSNEFRVGYTRVRDHREIDLLGPRIVIYDVDWGLDDYGDPETGTVYLGTENNSGVNAVDQDVFTLTDNLSIYKGEHTITLGTHNEFYNVGNAYIQYSTGYYMYDSLEDYFNDDAYRYYYGYATECDNQDYMPVLKAAQFGLYAQDEWKPNNKLTLTAGLRVDMPVFFNDPPVNEEFNSNSDLTNNGEYLVGTMPDSKLLWSPRVGFRYNLKNDGSSLLRGGVGLFTGRIPFVWLHNAFTNNGVDKQSITVYSSTDTPSLSNTSNEGVVGSQTLNTISKDFKMPQVFRANVAHERILGDGWKLTLEAMFTKNINNIAYTNVALEESSDKFYAVSADAATEASTYTYWNTKTDEYGAVINLSNTSTGYAYNLTAMIQKRFDIGLNFMASYTFGHSYAVNDGTSSVAFSNWQYNYAKNSNDLGELGYSSYDRPHVVNANLNYVTPAYGNGRWTSVVGLIYKGTSGSRFNYYYDDYGVDINNDGATCTLMYFPTDSEIDLMRFDSDESRETFRDWMNTDEYANANRGKVATSNAGSLPFYHRFDLHFAQNFVYNKKKNSRIEASLDIMNVSNLINRNWGMRYSASYGYCPLEVEEMVAVDGGYEAVYTWEGSQELYESEFSSRWYMQAGIRITF